MTADAMRLNAVAETVTGGACRVSDKPGCGLLEKVDENALAHELRKAGLKVEQQKRSNVTCDGMHAGEYGADPPVAQEIIVAM